MDDKIPDLHYWHGLCLHGAIGDVFLSLEVIKLDEPETRTCSVYEIKTPLDLQNDKETKLVGHS